MTKNELINEISKLNNNFITMLIEHTQKYDLPEALACNKSYADLIQKIIDNLEVKEK